MYGIALRSEVFSPALIRRMLPLLEESQVLSSVWFPDVGEDALELSALALGSTRRLTAATGVIRVHEHQPGGLARRVSTIDAWAPGRFILGVGTGAGSGKKAIENLISSHREFVRLTAGRIKVVFSALGPTMFRLAAAQASGVLLNFCSPEYARILCRDAPRSGFLVGAYVKLFYSKTQEAANRMLVAEFKKYSEYANYSRLFQRMGVAQLISSLTPESCVQGLENIALANPSGETLRHLLQRFVDSGVNTPIVYPYIEGDDDQKLGRVSEILKSLG